MTDARLALGIDLGTSGVRVAVIDSNCSLLFSSATGYRQGLHAPSDWTRALKELIPSIPERLRRQLGALAVDGTSGTLLACTHLGDPLGDALPYHQACPEQIERVRDLIAEDGPACSASSISRGFTSQRDRVLMAFWRGSVISGFQPAVDHPG